MNTYFVTGLNSVSTFPNPDTNCTDTQSWHNDQGFDCDDYGRKFCQNRKARKGRSQYLGERYNHPENNCCVCGKDYGE